MKTKNLVLSGLFMALGLVMPFLTGQIPSIGSKLLPMHIPILLCGFVCGWPYGLIVGFITPIFRSILFGMPPMFPVAMAMAFELAAYGFVSGLMYNMLPKKTINLFLSLITAMILGRVVWGIISVVLYGLNGMAFSWEIFIGGALINAIPGIIVQIIIIPIILITLIKAKVLENDQSNLFQRYSSKPL